MRVFRTFTTTRDTGTLSTEWLEKCQRSLDGRSPRLVNVVYSKVQVSLIDLIREWRYTAIFEVDDI